MIIESHGIPIPYQIGATFSSWILLAGFILLPGTFTSLGNISKESIPGEIKAFILNVPLLYLSGACCLIGLVGIGFLWHRFQRNYIWVTSYLIRSVYESPKILAVDSNVSQPMFSEFSKRPSHGSCRSLRLSRRRLVNNCQGHILRNIYMAGLYGHRSRCVRALVHQACWQG